MKKAVWMSFDLGIQANYDSLYQWLDTQGAIDCGESVAFFKFDPGDGNDIPGQIKNSLTTVIDQNSKVRIYVIWRAGGKMKGRFIFGQRKAAPWAGYAPKPVTEENG
jgi:hypothetical protein